MEKTIESNVTFDDRKKLMVHTTKEIQNTELGEVILNSKGTYNEKSIRKILSDLAQKKDILNKNIEKLKELNIKPQMNTELEKLKENLKLLQIINHIENVSQKDKLKETEDLNEQEKNLKKVNKDITDIKNAIKSRIKL